MYPCVFTFPKVCDSDRKRGKDYKFRKESTVKDPSYAFLCKSNSFPEAPPLGEGSHGSSSAQLSSQSSGKGQTPED